VSYLSDALYDLLWIALLVSFTLRAANALVYVNIFFWGGRV